MNPLTLEILDYPLAIHRFAAGSRIPQKAFESSFFSVTRTPDEVSIVCEAGLDLNSDAVSGEWAGLKVAGPLDFSLTGILAGLSSCLADAGVSLFSISTYDTDYILVRQKTLEKAVEALGRAGHRIAGKNAVNDASAVIPPSD